jgi:hypothetical protein
LKGVRDRTPKYDAEAEAIRDKKRKKASLDNDISIYVARNIKACTPFGHIYRQRAASAAKRKGLYRSLSDQNLTNADLILGPS